MNIDSLGLWCRMTKDLGVIDEYGTMFDNRHLLLLTGEKRMCDCGCGYDIYFAVYHAQTVVVSCEDYIKLRQDGHIDPNTKTELKRKALIYQSNGGE